jgi:hypothetical protein
MASPAQSTLAVVTTMPGESNQNIETHPLVSVAVRGSSPLMLAAARPIDTVPASALNEGYWRPWPSVQLRAFLVRLATGPGFVCRREPDGERRPVRPAATSVTVDNLGGQPLGHGPCPRTTQDPARLMDYRCPDHRSAGTAQASAAISTVIGWPCKPDSPPTGVQDPWKET